MPAHADRPIGYPGLIGAHPAAGGSPDLYLGRDLFGWGRFDDDTADGGRGWTRTG